MDIDQLLKQDDEKKPHAPRPDRTAKTNPGDNEKYINHALRLASLPAVSTKDAEQVRNRTVEYFTICAEEDMKPSITGLAVSLGIDRRRLWEIREGVKGGNGEVADVLKKATALLDLQMVNYMQNGKINPVAGIFMMKNHFGYKDEQEVVIGPKDPLGEAPDVEALRRKYEESLIPDA